MAEALNGLGAPGFEPALAAAATYDARLRAPEVTCCAPWQSRRSTESWAMLRRVPMTSLGLIGTRPPSVVSPARISAAPIPGPAMGGLLSRGHPIGATGCAQIVELTDQLRGRCGDRQVKAPQIALAENGGGWLGDGPAAAAVSILGR